jgi:hypothetical protein
MLCHVTNTFIVEDVIAHIPVPSSIMQFGEVLLSLVLQQSLLLHLTCMHYEECYFTEEQVLIYLLAAHIVLILEVLGEHVLIPLSAKDVTVDWRYCLFCFYFISATCESEGWMYLLLYLQ